MRPCLLYTLTVRIAIATSPRGDRRAAEGGARSCTTWVGCRQPHRALLYIRMASGSGRRAQLAVLKALREMQPPMSGCTSPSSRRSSVCSRCCSSTRSARSTQIRRLLPDHSEEHARALDVLRQVINARGMPTEEESRRLKRIEIDLRLAHWTARRMHAVQVTQLETGALCGQPSMHERLERLLQDWHSR